MKLMQKRKIEEVNGLKVIRNILYDADSNNKELVTIDENYVAASKVPAVILNRLDREKADDGANCCHFIINVNANDIKNDRVIDFIKYRLNLISLIFSVFVITDKTFLIKSLTNSGMQECVDFRSIDGVNYFDKLDASKYKFLYRKADEI